MGVDTHELAQNMLANFDALTPGRAFNDPIDLSAAQAYALQAEVARLREARGERLIGYKVGCTSAAIQAQVGVREPIFGRLFDTGCQPAGPRLSSRCFANLAIEGELAVRLALDLHGDDLTEEQCREAIAEVMPVIELHHYVLPKTCPPGPWMIASNGLHAGVVLPAGEALGLQYAGGMRRFSLSIDGTVMASVEDDVSLAQPVTSLQWLSRRLTPLGLRLRRGQLILTGSSLPLYPVGPGNHIVVEAPPLGACCVEIGP